MAAFEEQRSALEELGVSVYAASVDSEEKTREVADSGVSFPLAHGVTHDDAERIGAWWDGRRDFIQPSEFLLAEGGRILASSYSSSPLARMDAADVISMLRFIEARRKERQKSH